LDDLLAFIAQSSLARAMKSARYIYPVVNAAHILGLATLFGSILALDLRLLGAFRSIPVQPLARVLPRIAAGGLATAVVTGALLFTVEPQDYAANRAFLTKAALVLLGILHALYLQSTDRWRRLAHGGGAIGLSVRISALVSLMLWTATILAGRFIAF
jgi:hypothetical protein